MRGTATSGHVQSSRARVHHHRSPGPDHRRPPGRGGLGPPHASAGLLSAAALLRGNAELQEHAHKRQLESRLLLLRDELEDEGLVDEEVEERVAMERIKLYERWEKQQQHRKAEEEELSQQAPSQLANDATEAEATPASGPPLPLAPPRQHQHQNSRACYNCGEPGHLARHCPLPPSSVSRAGDRRRDNALPPAPPSNRTTTNSHVQAQRKQDESDRLAQALGIAPHAHVEGAAFDRELQSEAKQRKLGAQRAADKASRKNERALHRQRREEQRRLRRRNRSTRSTGKVKTKRKQHRSRSDSESDSDRRSSPSYSSSSGSSSSSTSSRSSSGASMSSDFGSVYERRGRRGTRGLTHTRRQSRRSRSYSRSSRSSRSFSSTSSRSCSSRSASRSSRSASRSSRSTSRSSRSTSRSSRSASRGSRSASRGSRSSSDQSGDNSNRERRRVRSDRRGEGRRERPCAHSDVPRQRLSGTDRVKRSGAYREIRHGDRSVGYDSREPRKPGLRSVESRSRSQLASRSRSSSTVSRERSRSNEGSQPCRSSPSPPRRYGMDGEKHPRPYTDVPISRKDDTNKGMSRTPNVKSVAESSNLSGRRRSRSRASDRSVSSSSSTAPRSSSGRRSNPPQRESHSKRVRTASP